MQKTRKNGFYVGSLAKSWWIDNGNNGGNKKKVFHATTKSNFVCNRIIKTSSNENDLVYIPFAGAGSEIEACIRNNRNWIASEINKTYIDEIIIPRINKIAQTSILKPLQDNGFRTPR
jgi:DNA modification methylase